LFDNKVSNKKKIINKVLNNEKYDKITNKILNIKQMLSINEKFTLYFENIIKVLMFCWI